MSGTKKTHILKTECMIGNRTFPTRNKTQIIKKKTKPLQMNLHFIAFLMCLLYLLWKGGGCGVTTR